MTRPRRYLLRMLLFVVVVAAAAAFLYEPLKRAFLANPPLNGLILGVLLFGILYNFRQVLRLLAGGELARGVPRRPRGPVAGRRSPGCSRRWRGCWASAAAGCRSSALAMRSLLDGIASRLDESRELSRYMIGLLIFLGLLGTFWGLLADDRLGRRASSAACRSAAATSHAVFAKLQERPGRRR